LERGFCARYEGVDGVCGLCVAPAQEGEPCGGNDEIPCDYELACHQGKCIKLGGVGDSCTTAKPCAGTWCNQGLCAPKLLVGADCDPNQVWPWNNG
jgi:hypothetical protein